jgi:hypothetical protein
MFCSLSIDQATVAVYPHKIKICTEIYTLDNKMFQF